MKEKIFFEGKETNYSVSDEGKIYNDKTGRELKGTLARNEYHSVQLSIGGRLKTFMIHRLVAKAFCDNPHNYTIVDHINRNKLDNRAENLRWVSNKGNAENIEKTGTSREIKKLDFINEEVIICPINDKYVVTRSGIIARRDNLNILAGHLRNGYCRVDIASKLYSVHRLVYEAFNGPIPEGMIVDHIDGNRANNALSNLRLIMQKENIKATYLTNRKGMVGITSFTPEGQKVKHYNTIKEASNELGVTHAAIKAASNYGTKSCGFYWLRDDSISTEKEFISKMPEDAKYFNDMVKTRISNNGLLYSATSKHLIPQFEDDNGKYWFVSSKDGKYVKFYNP